MFTLYSYLHFSSSLTTDSNVWNFVHSPRKETPKNVKQEFLTDFQNANQQKQQQITMSNNNEQLYNNSSNNDDEFNDNNEHPRKQDGSLDMRYKANQADNTGNIDTDNQGDESGAGQDIDDSEHPRKQDGTLDKRFKQNQE